MQTVESHVDRQKRFIILFFWCLLWSGLSAQTAFSQNNRNTITGFVFDTRRNSIPQIHVEVMNEVGQVLQRVRTDGSGRFFFAGLSSGRFLVKVLPYGTDFEEQTQEVEIINFVRPGSSTSENAQKDFYLRPRRENKEANVVAGTVFAQDTPEKAQKLYAKALSHFEDEKDEVAVQELLSALKVFPDYFLALERLGREYIKQQKYDYAQAVFIKTVSVNPRSFSGWYGLSYASYALKQPEIAIEAAQKASEIEPASVNSSLILGISLRQAKRYIEAEKSLLFAKKLANNQVPDVHWNLALLYSHNLKRYKDAANELELYLKIQTDDAKIVSIKKLIADLRAKSTAN